MISFIKGTISEKGADFVIVETSGGVGYKITVSRLQAAEYQIGQDVQINTYFKVSDSGMELFGFASQQHREFFSLLLSVKSVGPKSAMHILSIGSIHEIQSAIARGDVAYLTAVQGMGKKTAERIVVELKNKVQAGASGSKGVMQGDGVILGEVIDGLVAMGYGKEEAKQVVQLLDAGEKTTEELLREALKQMSK